MTHQHEVEAGARFEFGKNWSRFLAGLDESAIQESIKSLQRNLGVMTLEGKTFLDIGSGSGLSSLAARRMGARVVSFDFDPHSVACTRELRRRYFRDDSDVEWQVHEGSILDPEFVSRLPVADVVYSWGVLHHTGKMWAALEASLTRVRPGGLYYIAIYNDQGWRSKTWTAVKRLYNSSAVGKWSVILGVGLGFMWSKKVVGELVRGRNPAHYWTRYKSNRGMNAWYDMIDWVGGYPFEVATVDTLFEWAKVRGFRLENMATVGGGHGCNEVVFRSVT